MIISTVGSGKKGELKNFKTTLKFNRYRDRYFLSRFSNPAEGIDLQILKSKEEIQIAKEFKEQKTIAALISLTGKK